MNKLFKLKQWLTIKEAAKHLSNEYAEPVNEADVLKLGLDRHLTLSVNFINGVPAKKGKIVPSNEAITYKYENILDLFGEYNISDSLKGKIHQAAKKVIKDYPNNIYSKFEAIASEYDVTKEHVMEIAELNFIAGVDIGNNEVIEIDNAWPTIIDGIWDLPMTGGERLGVSEHYHMKAFGIEEIEKINIDGVFVSGKNNIIYQIQEYFEDDKDLNGARNKQHKKLRKLQFSKSTNRRKAKLIELHQEKLKKLNEQWEKWVRNDRYYPAGRLPDDFVLVVRTSAITDFLNKADIEVDSKKIHTEKSIANDSKDKELERFIKLVIVHFPEATTKDIASHCFDRCKPTDRIVKKAKNIAQKLGVKRDSSQAKRTDEKIKYMQGAPKY